MTRVKSRRVGKRRVLFKSNKGFVKSSSSKTFKIHHQRFLKAQANAFGDRHKKKQVLRRQCISRLRAFSETISKKNYNQLINELRKNKVRINRKMLSQLSVFDPDYLTDLTYLPFTSNLRHESYQDLYLRFDVKRPLPFSF